MQNINICDSQRTPPLHRAVRCGNVPAVKTFFFYLGPDVSVVKADKNDAIRLKRLKNEPERVEEYIEFVFPEADVRVVKAVKYDAIRLERLKNEPERMEEYLNFKKGSTQKPLQNISNQRIYCGKPLRIQQRKKAGTGS